MSTKLHIIFAGTTDFAACHLATLLEFGYRIVGVFTQPDRPAGRGKKLICSPVKALAERKGLSIFQPISLHIKSNQQLIANLHADIMVVVAYGLILPKEVLDIPRLGCINVHASLLPRWRGAAPIQRALLAGDSKTGITIIQIDEGIDTGNILYKMICPITDEDTTVTLYNKLTKLGQEGLIETLYQLETGTMIPELQDESVATYAKKINKEEARINLYLPAVQLERCIRAFNPWPVSWFMINEQPIKVWKASVIHIRSDAKPGTLLEINQNGIQIATSDGILNLKLLQLTNKKIISAQDLFNSRREWFTHNTRFS